MPRVLRVVPDIKWMSPIKGICMRHSGHICVALETEAVERLQKEGSVRTGMRSMTGQAHPGGYRGMNDLLVEFPVTLITELRHLRPEKVRIITGVRAVAEGAHPGANRRVDGLTAEVPAVVTIEA